MCRFSCHGFDAICEPKAFILKFALCVAFFPFFSRSLCIFFAVSLSLSLSLSLDFLSVGFFLFLFITILLVYVWSSVDSLYAYNYFIPFRSFFVRLFHCHFILRQMIVYMCFSFLFCSFPFARSLAHLLLPMLLGLSVLLPHAIFRIQPSQYNDQIGVLSFKWVALDPSLSHWFAVRENGYALSKRPETHKRNKTIFCLQSARHTGFYGIYRPKPNFATIAHYSIYSIHAAYGRPSTEAQLTSM